jgi:tetratricopeptide (TPR) repeat protein
MRTEGVFFLAGSVVLTGCLFFSVSCGRSPQAYLEKGNNFFSAGKYSEAALNYRKAVGKDARFGEAYYRLGLTELKLNNSSEAYKALSSAVDLLPQRSDVRISLADVLLPAYMADKRRPLRFYNQLKKLSNDLLAQNPRSYDGLKIKGTLAWSDGHLEESARLLAKADQAKPAQPELIAEWAQVLFLDGQDSEGERLANQFIQAHQDAGKIYDVLYQHYLLQKRPADAEKILQAKVQGNPRESGYVIQLASFYASTGKRDQMLAALQPLADPRRFPDGHLKIGDFYAARQDWAEAFREYQAGANANPGQRLIYLKRVADVWLQQGKGEEAAGIVREILKEQPNDEAAQAVNASIQLKSGRRDKIAVAVKALQDLVAKSPDNALWRFNLGRALMVSGDLDGARVQFLEALKKRPGFLPPRLALAEVSRLKRDYSQTLAYANEILNVKPDYMPARVLKAVGLIGLHRYSEARSELADLERQSPTDRQVQFQLAVLDVSQKNFAAAEARLQKLSLQANHDSSILAALVDVYQDEHRPDKALDLLNSELKKSPDSAPLHALLADTALHNGNYELALQQYQFLVARGVHSAHLQERIGTAYEFKGKLNEAVASFQAAKDLAPRDPAVLLALADAQRLAGRKMEAIANYRSLLGIDPENSNAMNHLAYLLVSDDATVEEARTLVERALKKMPHQPDFEDTLGLVYLKKGFNDAAVQLFKTLANKYPVNALFRYHYGLALFQTGQKDSARTQLETALSLNSSEDVHKGIATTLAKLP